MFEFNLQTHTEKILGAETVHTNIAGKVTAKKQQQ